MSLLHALAVCLITLNHLTHTKLEGYGFNNQRSGAERLVIVKETYQEDSNYEHASLEETDVDEHAVHWLVLKLLLELVLRAVCLVTLNH